MRETQQHGRPSFTRRSMLLAGAAGLCMPRLALAQARETVRIGVPTKTYWPTIICETAIRQSCSRRRGSRPS